MIAQDVEEELYKLGYKIIYPGEYDGWYDVEFKVKPI